MIVCKFFEHADHVVLIGIHEALRVHLGFAHRTQARWVRCCAGMAEMVTVDESFDQRWGFNSVTLRNAPTEIVIILINDNDVSLVLSFGK